MCRHRSTGKVFRFAGAFGHPLVSVVIGLAMLSSALQAANCTPDTITLSSQSEVDDFQASHGPCDTITGVLTISGGDITDLSGLSGIVAADFGSRILIQNNTTLASLDGFSGLTSARWIEINSNPALTSISGLSGLGVLSGPLFIQGNASLGNLDGLESVTNLFQGGLILWDNPNLADLSGLASLTSIASSLSIENNASLQTLDDLSGLESVGAPINIIDNSSLTSIAGLAGLTDFSSALSITGNPVLQNLDGLSSITSLGGLRIQFNPLLTDVDGLSGLTTVGTIYAALGIDNNAALENLDGLAGLVSLDADLAISDNPLLSQCAGLARLLDPIDHALPGPGPGDAGIPDVNGDVVLSGNLSGCNSVEQIVESGSARPIGATFIAGEAEFLLKGSAVTRGCLESMIRLPGPVITQTRELLLKCSAQTYADDETLVFSASDASCRTLRARNDGSTTYVLSVQAPHTSYSGSLEEVADALFDEDADAFLVLNLRTSELTRVGTLACAGSTSGDLVFADGFEQVSI